MSDLSHLVSIITPCFNCDSIIQKCIDSVIFQTYSNWELLIIDDVSEDGSRKVVESYMEKDSRIKLLARTWNAGPAVTRNRGISEAKGRFIAFLDADDIWRPNKLEKQIDFMLRENIALSYSAYEVMDDEGNVIGIRTPPESLSYDDILRSNQIGCLTAIYDTKHTGKVFMPNIAKRQDMGLWLKILKNGMIAKGLVDEPLASYRKGSNTISSNKVSVLKYQWRIYREIEQLPLLTSLYYFMHYAYNGIVRSVF